ncbi:MAG TPA: hypothetical protein VJ204_16085 [Solirubrobacterales bacterium]|nr:hypothetical protein [Solirubrobacterales bacterium]
MNDLTLVGLLVADLVGDRRLDQIRMTRPWLDSRDRGAEALDDGSMHQRHFVVGRNENGIIRNVEPQVFQQLAVFNPMQAKFVDGSSSLSSPPKLRRNPGGI